VVKIYHSPLISETAVGQKAKAPLIKKRVDHEGRAKGGRSMLRPYFVFRTTIVESFRALAQIFRRWVLCARRLLPGTPS
jgi:hypothetical protein